jgi:hypothetical protein
MTRRPEIAQEHEDHHHHQRDGQQQRELHVGDRGADGLGAVADDLDLDRRRDRATSRGSVALILSTVSMTLAPGCLDGLADVADPHRRAVAVGDDDVVPVLRLQQLVVGVDGVGAGGAVDIALRAVRRW